MFHIWILFKSGKRKFFVFFFLLLPFLWLPLAQHLYYSAAESAQNVPTATDLINKN